MHQSGWWSVHGHAPEWGGRVQQLMHQPKHQLKQQQRVSQPYVLQSLMHLVVPLQHSVYPHNLHCVIPYEAQSGRWASWQSEHQQQRRYLAA